MANENYICRHGSLWCHCRHNIHRFGEHDNTFANTVMMGRPKYPPRGPRAKGKKQK